MLFLVLKKWYFGVGSKIPTFIKIINLSLQEVMHTTQPEEHSGHSGHLGGVQTQPKMRQQIRSDIKTCKSWWNAYLCIRCQTTLVPHLSTSLVFFFYWAISSTSHTSQSHISLPTLSLPFNYKATRLLMEMVSCPWCSFDIKNHLGQHLYMTVQGCGGREQIILNT